MTLVCDIKLAMTAVIPDGIFYSKNSRIDPEKDYMTCKLLNLVSSSHLGDYIDLKVHKFV